MKDKVRPIYSELQGYLSQAPSLNSSYTQDVNLWESFNTCVVELSNITSRDDSKFKITPRNVPGGDGWQSYSEIEVSTYRSKLSGLINRLYGEYFSDEVQPFSGSPSSVLNLSQNQSQTQHQQLQVFLFQLNDKIEELQKRDDLEENEKTFLNKLKQGIPLVTGILQLLELILKLANDNGVLIKRLLEILF